MVADRLAAAARHLSRWQFPAARDILRDLLGDPANGATAMQRQTARRMLAEALREMGAVREAYALAAPLVTECVQAHGDRHPATIRSAGLLAAILHDLGDLDRAECLYRLVLAMPLDRAGPAARAVAIAAANAALLQADRGDLASAHNGLVASHAQFRQAFGGADLDTIRIGADLAALHQRMGDLTAARRVLAVTHAAARGALGEQHPLARAVEADLAAIEPPMPEPKQWAESAAGRHTAPPEAPRIATERPRRRKRLAVAVAAVAAGAATAGAGIGYPRLAPVFDETAPLSSTGEPSPTASRPVEPGLAAPTEIRLRDGGGTLRVTWMAPPDPGITALVEVTRPGRGRVASAELGPGVSTYQIEGLSSELEYCVTVSLADGPGRHAAAAPVCTHRTA